MSKLAQRVEARIRAEWPGTSVVKPHGIFHAPDIAEGGVTDTMVHMVARIIAEEAAEIEEKAWQYDEVSK